MSESENKRAIDFKLREPISLATKDGDFDEFDTLTMIAPSSRDRSECARIKNFYSDVMRTFREKQAMNKEKAEEVIEAIERLEEKKKEKKENKTDDDEGFTGKNLVAICGMVETDDARQENVYKWYRTLFVKNQRCLIDGEKITGDLFDDLDFEDMDNLCCEYAVSFLIRSLVN